MERVCEITQDSTLTHGTAVWQRTNTVSSLSTIKLINTIDQDITFNTMKRHSSLIKVIQHH